MKKTEFVGYIEDLLYTFSDGIEAKSMFGGYGIYNHGLIMGLVADDMLYFKVNSDTKNIFQSAGSAPFTYVNKKGKEVKMPYYQIPSEILEDRDNLYKYFKLAMTAAIGTQKINKG